MEDIQMKIYKREVEAVKRLGEQIGYGNIMYIASSLWALDLKQQGYPENGAFYPVIECDIKKGKLLNWLKEERKVKMEMYKEMGV